MQIKYSDVISLETNDVNEIKKILDLSIQNAKKYGDSFCEIGKVLISFGKVEFDDRTEITSYIHVKNGGDYLRIKRVKKELLNIIKLENKI
ncbi:MAG: hypothetical protein PHF46_00180 [Candidatus Gracilibacteria bacterium]|nr:hypothetical protein [Candidatus Gracilibacteria bacterium]MDD4531060.1 hypothetical protein [Candidatus Gracilibacteria bacterium]